MRQITLECHVFDMRFSALCGLRELLSYLEILASSGRLVKTLINDMLKFLTIARVIQRIWNINMFKVVLSLLSF